MRCGEPGCRKAAVADGARCAAHSVALYAAALPPALQQVYETAIGLQGLEEEIAVLRTMAWDALKNADSKELAAMHHLLIRAVATQYRVARKADRDLSESVVNVLRTVADLMNGEDL